MKLTNIITALVLILSLSVADARVAVVDNITAKRVHVSGNYAYVGSGNPCLTIVDVSDPADPEVIGEVDFSCAPS